MTASDIIYIITTVAVAQTICDGLANRITYSSDVYKQRLAALERARIKRDKAVAQAAQNPIAVNSNSSAKAREKQTKKVQRAEEDFRVAATSVSQKHMVPNVLTGITFYMLYKILNLEYQGKIVAMLPFTPWKFFQRFTMRGLKFDPEFLFEGTKRIQGPEQACGFLIVYLLSTLSVKFMVKQVLGAKPPSGADKGLFTMIDDPRGQKFLTSLGVDMDDINEMRKRM
eukprot:CAMPEP_0203683166 /NCGR_PEP_ID=MMETSP0090-20130426/47380_1 /ASSEMBLY_ACC=CAM_ASM_001088 /TAXON_ID=426623 /ORGANISM="Chaetoceros affinis, Strain CCMP159" /LENGTH=226 /DNA_ID=CAMNT_0050552295 /DNA_START=16 /DNA_END=696 /DNA_ORIENTATION=-